MMTSAWIAVVLAAGGATAAGSSGGSNAPKVTVLKAAHLFDAKSDLLQSPGLVVVTGDKITAVGPKSTIPGGAEVIDLGNATLLPGFHDAHTHLTEENSGDWRQDWLDNEQRTIAEQTLVAAGYARKTLRAGFTSTRDVGSGDYIDVGLRNAINKGITEGPRMLVSVFALGTTGGHCDTTGYRAGILLHETGDGVADDPFGFRRLVRRNIKYGADVIKVCATGGVLSMTDEVDTPQLTDDELVALVDEAHTLHRKVAAHAHGDKGARRAVQAGVDSIEHGTFLEDATLDLMKQKGTYFTPTRIALKHLVDQLDKNNALPPPVQEKVKKAWAAGDKALKHAIAKGVKISFGTDAAVYPHGRNAEEFALLVDAGMTPAAALKSATAVDAVLFGKTEVGTLEAGKLADVIAVPNDPLADIHQTEHVFFVMKGGVVYRAEKP